MYTLNDKIKNLEPYQPNEGNFNIRCDANESCFDFPKHIREKIKDEVDILDFNRYPDPTAKELCKSFANYYNINPEFVTAGNGSDELISILMNCFMLKGETVVTIEPDFSMYNFYAFLAEVNCITVNKEADLSISADKVIKVINDNNAKAVIFSNPCNPTSVGLNKDEIVRIIKSVNALVILDEAYMDFWESSLLNRVEEFENLLIMRTASKAVGAAAIRLGFTVANTTLTKAIRAVKSPYNVNTLTQKIGKILYDDSKYLANLKKTIVSLRENLYNSLKDLEIKYNDRLLLVSGTSNFVFIRTNEAKAIYDYYIKNGVAIRFMGDYIRITTGTNEENSVIVSLLENYLQQ